MSELKKLYNSGVNIMEYFREHTSVDENSINAILASYDLQAGSYVAALCSEQVMDKFHVDSQRVPMTHKLYLDKFSDELANEINKYEYESILEAGVGEATTFTFVVNKLKNKAVKACGFDISPSRIKVAREFAKNNNQEKADLFVAGLENIPFADNSFDIVYTVHAIEPNSNNEKSIVEELYRVAKKYLILVEPSYELGNEETRKNIETHKYIKNLKSTIDDLGYNILRYELSPIGTYTNQPAIIVIQKEHSGIESSVEYCCPVCKLRLELIEDNYFCEKCSLVYPVLSDIPFLDSNRAIFFSKYKD